MIRDLCILGAGNAGLIAALMSRACFENIPIIVIKSNKFSTIGVGEGSNEHWLDFTKITKISVDDIILHAGATFKHGIKFTNWRNGDDCYYHSLPEWYTSQDSYTGLPFTLMNLVANNTPADKIVFELALQGKIAGPLGADVGQFHFNTFKLNSFLEKLCVERNIKIIEDTILDVKLDNWGNVKELVGEKLNYASEFFIDTSGFSRVIHSKLESKWISYQEYLPTNAAIAFPSPLKGLIPTFTECKARQYGWSWRAPVQDRYGNGYVYNDSMLDVKSAVSELQNDYDEDILVAKQINFNPGRVDKFWIKNCVAVGLSGSFIEPLEASNIGTTIEQMKCFCASIICWSSTDQWISKKYNQIFARVSENILDFVQLHYITQREDTEFWRWCKYDMPLTSFNKDTLDYFKTNFVSYNFFHENNYELFDELDWIQVMHGLGLFDVEKIKQLYFNNFKEWELVTKKELSKIPNEQTWEFLSHEQTIELIKHKWQLQNQSV